MAKLATWINMSYTYSMSTIMVLVLLFSTGCETTFTRDIRFHATGLNHQPKLEVDMTQMQPDSIEIIKESGKIGSTGNSSTVYHVKVPAKIVIIPLDDPPFGNDVPR